MASGKKTGGRAKGTPNRASAERQKTIEQSGLTPLDYMLSVLRDLTKDDPARMDAAKAAAPYVHAKLNSVEHKGGVEVTTRTKEERDAIVAAALRADT